MKNIIQSIIYTLAGLASLGWISIYLIIRSVSDPGPDSNIVAFFDDKIIAAENYENLGFESCLVLFVSINFSIFFSILSDSFTPFGPNNFKPLS